MHLILRKSNILNLLKALQLTSLPELILAAPTNPVPYLIEDGRRRLKNCTDG